MIKLGESWTNREELVTLLLKSPGKPRFPSTTESRLAPQKRGFPAQRWKGGSRRVGLELRDSNFIADTDSKQSPASLLSTLGLPSEALSTLVKLIISDSTK